MATVPGNRLSPTDLREFLPVAINTFVPTPRLEFDLFIRPERAGPVVMFRERRYPLEATDLDRLAETGVDTLYIPSASHVAYCRYLHKEVINNDRVPPMQRYTALRSANRRVFEAAFRGGNMDRMVDFVNKFGRQLTDVVCGQRVVLLNLLPLMAHDYYTYTHTTNVCTYCLVLASELGICEEAELRDIATGALLHDLGKRLIPPAVLNYPGRLNKKQWELVRRHPVDGFRDLCFRRDLSWAQLMMVYQHHERPDGRGYPVGAVEKEIHLWARICKVADAFDALTSARPYRKAGPLDHVLDFLAERAGTEFDRDIVQCLRATIRSGS
jgi:response regulator RpfG family c-di-GMP phosphodiesterase